MMLLVLPPADEIVMDSDVYYSFHSAVSLRAMAVYGRCCRVIVVVWLCTPRHHRTRACALACASQLLQCLPVLVQAYSVLELCPPLWTGDWHTGQCSQGCQVRSNRVHCVSDHSHSDAVCHAFSGFIVVFAICL